MARLNIDNASLTNYSGIGKYRVAARDTDGISGQKETVWTNTRWRTQWGLFTEVAELQNAITMKSLWNMGKGWTADPENRVQLMKISGWGKDTFDDILFNMDVMSMVAGDSYAHIIRNKDDKEKRVINLKPLNPGSIRHIIDEQGMIVRYEQFNRIGETIKKFEPEEILHLCYNRLADQIHGISLIDKMEKVTLADERSFDDMSKIMSFQAKPFIIFKLKTDNQTKIATFAEKIRQVRSLGEDLFIPDDENLLSWEVVQISPSQIIMEWRNDLRNKFYRAAGLPQIVPGGGEGSESDSRTRYLAFEQLVAARQRYIEQQFELQTGLVFKLVPPTTMMELVGSDQNKDSTEAFGGQPSQVNPSADQQ